MTAQAFKEQYKGMSSREVRELISNSRDFKREIQHIYCDLMHQTMNRNCNDCYMDAYIIIMNTPNDKINAMSEREFELRAGAVLTDVVKNDRAKMCNAKTLTDELALYHLATNPDYIRLFAKFPEDWQERAIKANITIPAENAAETNEAPAPIQVTTEQEKVPQKARKPRKKANK